MWSGSCDAGVPSLKPVDTLQYIRASGLASHSMLKLMGDRTLRLHVYSREAVFAPKWPPSQEQGVPRSMCESQAEAMKAAAADRLQLYTASSCALLMRICLPVKYAYAVHLTEA